MTPFKTALVSIIALILVCFGTAACSIAASNEASAQTGATILLQNGFTMDKFVNAYPAQAGIFKDAYATSSKGPADSIFVHRYTDLNVFKSDIASGVLVKGDYAMYDIEDWSQTPAAQYDNAKVSMRAFNSAGKAAGIHVIETPALDLGNAVKHPGETNEQWFISDYVARAAGDNGTFGVEIQTQTLDTNPSAYANLYKVTAAQAKTYNAYVWVASGVSDNYGTPAQAAVAVKAANPQGVFLNVKNTDLGWESSFLSDL